MVVEKDWCGVKRGKKKGKKQHGIKSKGRERFWGKSRRNENGNSYNEKLFAHMYVFLKA